MCKIIFIFSVLGERGPYFKKNMGVPNSYNFENFIDKS